MHRVRLPRQVCFCRRYQCTDAKDAAIKLRDTYIATARTGKMSMGSRMFTVRAGSPCKELDVLCCIPVSEDLQTAETIQKTTSRRLPCPSQRIVRDVCK